MTDKNTTDVATTDQDVDMTTLGDVTGTMVRPKTLDRNDLSGTEDIDPDEVRLPRLSIAQGLSPQITPGDQQFIEGLTLFDMFNDLTGENYGKGPMTFVPVRREVRRIHFVPRSEGGGIIDPDVPKGDPRLKWTKSNPSLIKADIPPLATELVEFVVLLLRKGKQPEPIVFSIATKNKWNRRASDKLTTVIKLRPPIYSNMFSVDTKVPAKNDKGTFGVPNVRDLGYIPKDSAAGAALFDHAMKFNKSLEGKKVEYAREPGADDDFDANAMEAESQADPKPEM